VYRREQLVEIVWGYSFLGNTRTVDVHVQHVRDKMEAAGARTAGIQTVWGVGYRFDNQ